jgi:OB-fold nucleic acid binding domain
MIRGVLLLTYTVMLFSRNGGLALKHTRHMTGIASHAPKAAFSRLYASATSPSVLASDIVNVKDNGIARLKVKKILESDDSIIGKSVTIKGWVRTVRDQKKFSFIEINDGSTLTGIQAVALAEIETYGEVVKFTTGAAVEIIGDVVASIGKGLS